jgi:hypothetical protein
MRDFVQSRIVGGRQRIRTHVTFHTAGELVLWPYGYTRRDVPPDMTELDLATFRAMGRYMARSNGYSAKQSSALYPTDGDMIDWMYARQRIFSFTFEMYPKGGGTPRHHYPPDEVIGRETRRNREALLYLISRAVCPYGALGRRAARNSCGPLFDDFEVARGWQVNARGTDTANDGSWQRGDPLKGDVQLGSAVSGRAVLITGRQPGHDVDGGRTTARSPYFTVPRRGATVSMRYWVGMTVKAGPQDGFAVRLVDTDGRRVRVLHKDNGDGTKHRPSWRRLSKKVPSALAGRRLAIELEAVDAGPEAIVEAAVDQVRVVAR